MKLILSIFLCAFLFSCNTAKQIAKKDQAALDRVEAKLPLLNHAGNVWQLLNPCYPDTIRIGKTVTVIDSSFAKENIEELNNTIAALLRPNQNIDSLKQAIRKEVEKNCKPVAITKYRIDTLPRDKRNEDILNATIQEKDNQISKLEGEKTVYEKQIKELKSTSARKTIWLIVAGLVILGLIIIGLRFIFTPKTK